jgi:PAS domain S-box-containing protein
MATLGDEFLVSHIHDICAVEDRQLLLRDLSEVGSQMRTLGTRRHRTKRGQVIDVEVAWSRLLFSGTESVLALLGDVTERNLAESSLWEREGHLRTVVMAAPVILWATDREALLTLSEGKGLGLLGLKAEELLGRSVLKLHPFPATPDRVHQALSGESSTTLIEVQGLTFESHYAPLRAAGGEISGVIGVAIDVTERERARAELEDTLQFNREIIASAADGIEVWDSNFHYVVWNPAMEKLTEMPAGSVLGHGALDLFPHLRETGVYGFLERALAGETILAREVPYRIPQSGRAGWISGTYGPHRDARGQIIGVVGVVSDITERRKTSRALEEQRQFLRRVLDINPHLVYAGDYQGRYTLANQAMADAYGTTIENLVGKTDADFSSSPEEAATFLRDDRQVLDSGHEKVIPEEVFTDSVGRRRCLWTIKRPLEDPDGVVRQVLGVSTDITELKEARERLRASEERFSKAFRASPAAMTISNLADGRYIDANESFLRLTGYRYEEVTGHTSVDLTFWANAEARAHAMERLRVEGFLQDVNATIRTRSGETREVAFSLELVDLNDTPCLLSMTHDITERKRAEASLLARTRQKSVLALLGQRALSDPKLDGLMKEAVSQVAETLDVDYAAILERLGGDTKLSPRASAGREELSDASVLSSGIGAHAVYTLFTHGPVLVEDFAHETRFEITPPMIGFGVVSGATVPVQGRQGPFGVLGVHTRERRVFNSDEVLFLTAVANVIAMVVEHGRFEGELHR